MIYPGSRGIWGGLSSRSGQDSPGLRAELPLQPGAAPALPSHLWDCSTATPTPCWPLWALPCPATALAERVKSLTPLSLHQSPESVALSALLPSPQQHLQVPLLLILSILQPLEALQSLHTSPFVDTALGCCLHDEGLCCLSGGQGSCGQGFLPAEKCLFSF